MMKFSYKKYGNVFRPIIPIKLKYKNNEIGYEVLVDSGADLCIFDAEIGEAIGIDIKKGKPKEIFGVGGKSSLYYLHEVSLDVGGWVCTIDAGFMPNVAGKTMQYGLVGQLGFFDYFIIKFDLDKAEIDLKPRENKF